MSTHDHDLHDDPRLTALALGELDAADEAALEEALAADSDSRAILEDIRRTAELLDAGLAAEGGFATLTDDQRAAIERAAGESTARRVDTGAPGSKKAAPAAPPRRQVPGWMWALAASLIWGMVFLGVSPLIQWKAIDERGAGEFTAIHARDDGVDAPDGTAENEEVWYSEVEEKEKEIGGRMLQLRGEARASREIAAGLIGEGRWTRTEEEGEGGTEEYDRIHENPWFSAMGDPLSTFSIDVDTASYANVRRYLKQQGQFPPPDAARIEEMVNYFSYGYERPAPDAEHPFAASIEVASCPWRPEHRLVRVGLAGRAMEVDRRPPSNLVFLIDVSGSMQSSNKLPLLVDSMKMLVENLGDRDRVSMVVYAGASGVVLEPTACESGRARIFEALSRLTAGGSTQGSAGIEKAYELAAAQFIEGGVNRVVLATDGDFNVGTTDRGSLTRLIEEKARTGVFLTVLGFGMGNYKDGTLEQLADKGNGNYAYIDSKNEARKVLVTDLSATLVTIAKDVKIQVEWNPAEVAAYRLVGYENRMLANRDFEDDTKDAGEIGAGHTVTALYEVVLVGAGGESEAVDRPPMRYLRPAELTDAAGSGEIMTLRVRYKKPDGDTSRLVEFTASDAGTTCDEASDDFQFAAAVATFGMLLRGSTHAGEASHDLVHEIASGARGEDRYGYRAEFLELVGIARALSAND